MRAGGRHEMNAALLCFGAIYSIYLASEPRDASIKSTILVWLSTSQVVHVWTTDDVLDFVDASFRLDDYRRLAKVGSSHGLWTLGGI